MYTQQFASCRPTRTAPRCTMIRGISLMFEEVNMRKILAVFLIWSCAAMADRIISDPFPLTGVQPTTCRVAYDGSTTFTGFSVLTNPDGSVYCSVTLPTLAAGTHVAAVKACIGTTTFECSDPPTPLSFLVAAPAPVGPPPAPNNLRVIK